MTAPTGAATDVAALIERERLVAIVRVDGADKATRIARALVAGGVRVLEFSLSAQGALDAIEACRGLDACVGAGTVLDIGQAAAAVDRGAQYLVAPGLDREVMRWAREAGVLHIPGAFSPTEVVAAQREGAPLVKLFPAGRLGPGYVSDLLGPLPDVRLVPTGGIDETNLIQFLEAGAAAVAVGSALARGDRSEEETTERARRITAALAGARRSQ
jgi:2-dehydro-3-deoxyphosphogluconate aldolase / (4S)-4-hydroxy-2-oxoglutarate aldolase